MKRQEIINKLSESIADDSKGLDVFIRELLEIGYRGFAEYSNDELIKVFANCFDQEVKIEN